MKAAELAGEDLGARPGVVRGPGGEPPGRRDEALLTAALWGNVADLGFQLSETSAAGLAREALLADDSERYVVTPERAVRPA